MSDSTEYKLIHSDGDDTTKIHPSRPISTWMAWTAYPGNRRDDGTREGSSSNLPTQQQHGSIMTTTGGNALQAIDKNELDKKQFISVKVPDGKVPGDTILVKCPYIEGRLISVTIPKGTIKPGDEFWVEVPQQHVVVKGRIRLDDEEAVRTSQRDILAAAAKNELANRKNHLEGTDTQDDEKENTNEGVSEQQQQIGPEGKVWVALMFLSKMMLG